LESFVDGVGEHRAGCYLAIVRQFKLHAGRSLATRSRGGSMSFPTHRAVAATLALLAAACGGSGDGPSGAGGASGAGGHSAGSGAPPGSDACVRYVYYVSACDGMPLPPGTHVSTGGCSAKDACIAQCGIDTPCDVLTDGSHHPDGWHQYQA